MSELPQLWRVDLAAEALFSHSYKRGAEIRLYALRWMARIGRDKGEKFTLEQYIDGLIDEFFCLFGARPHAASLGASAAHPLFALWTEMVNTAERAELLWWFLLGRAWQRHDTVVPGTAQTKFEEIDEFRWHTLFLSAGALGPGASGWAQVSSLLRPFSPPFVLSSGLAQPYSLSSIAAYLVTPATSPLMLLSVYRRTLLLRLLALAGYWHVECGLDGEVTLNLARFFAQTSSVHLPDARLPLQLLYGLPDSALSPAARDNAHELYLRFLALQVAKAPTGKVPRMWREIMLRKTLPPSPVTLVPDSNWPAPEGAFTLATASAFLAQLVVIAPTLHEADLKYCLPLLLACNI